MAEAMMQAARLHDYGGPEALVVESASRPQPGSGQVLVRLKAAGVNPADWKYGTGLYKQMRPLTFPWTPGLEGAGIVEAVGPEVTRFRAGQEVYGVMPGVYAEYTAAKEANLQPKPAGLNFEEAASLPIGALTAWGAVVDAAKVKAGERVLVQGAAGGVGGYAVQLARWKGARVTGTSSAANLEYVRSLGAESAIDYQAAPFETIVHDVDVLIDTVGGELIQRGLRVLRQGGLLVTMADRMSEDIGKAEGVQATFAGRAPVERLVQISGLIASKDLRPDVGAVFPLAEARRAMALSQRRHGRGRIILKIA